MITLAAGAKRLLFVLTVLLAASSANAATYVGAGWGRAVTGCGLSPSSRLASAEAACDVIAATCYGTSDPGQIHWVSGNDGNFAQCNGQSNLGTNTPLVMKHFAESCSDGSVPVGGACGTATTTGSTTTTTANNCPAAGTSAGEQNFTVGWRNTSDSNAPLPSVSAPTGGCISSCAVSVGAVVNCWGAQQPSSTGMYRLSCDYPTTYTGQTCTPSASNPDPSAASTTAAPPCAGTMGTVNGNPVCLDSGTTPPTATPPKTPLPGNPVPGPTATNGAPKSHDPTTGAGSANPPGAAGGAGGGVTQKPSGGSGGGSVTVNVDIPKDYNKEATQLQIRDSLKTDGAPTMADQKVRIDDAANKGKTDLGDLVEAAKGSQESDKGRWFSWVWTPPIGSCSPFTGSVSGFAVSWDLCPTINNIKDVMGWFFGLIAAMNIYSNLFRRDS